MSLVGSSSKSIRKTDLINQKQLAVGFKKTIVYHEAILGDSTINLNSLTMPTSLSSLGFIQATPSEVQSAQIKTYHKNVTITSSARGLLIEGLSYTITSSTVITFTSDFGTALAGEIFIITVDMNARSGFIGVDAVPIIVTGTLLAGSDTFNVGSQFRVNYNPAQQIGEIIVLMNGVAQFRNVGNATAAPAADGNYQELDAGGGWGTQIKFNAADTIDQPIMILSSGLRVVRPDGSLVQELENINGTIQQLVSVTAALSGLPTNYFNSPSFPDLKAFGDRVYNLESAAMNIGGIKNFTDGAVIKGVTSGSVAAAGDIGEIVSVAIPASTLGSTTIDVDTTVVSLTIPSAGYWDIRARFNRNAIMTSLTGGHGVILYSRIYNGATPLDEHILFIPTGLLKVIGSGHFFISNYYVSGSATITLKFRCGLWASTEVVTIAANYLNNGNGTGNNFYAIRVR